MDEAGLKPSLRDFGVAVIAVELLSRIRFFMNAKLTHLLGMMVLFAAGVGLILRSYRDSAEQAADEDKPKTRNDAEE